MSHKYVIRQKLGDNKYQYYTNNSLTGFDIRINESMVYDSHEDAFIDALTMKRDRDGIEVIAVEVKIHPVRAKKV